MFPPNRCAAVKLKRMTDELLAELTRLAHGASPDARAWIGKHIHMDNVATRRSKGRVRGIKVRLAHGGSPAILDERLVRENGMEIDPDEEQGLRRGSRRAVRRAVRLPPGVARRGTRSEAFDYNNPRDVADLMRIQIAEGERGLAKLLE